MDQSLAIRVASIEDLPTAVAIDEDACALFEENGLHFDIAPEHPFARAEYARWGDALRAGNGFLAVGPDGAALGLLIMGQADGLPHLEQLSVRRTGMRRGLGRRLVHHAIAWASGQDLWLTTYAHVPWNRPFYEQEGFNVVPPERCGPEVLATLAEQRRWLPAPTERIAMRRRPRVHARG